ncbi:MAG: hypothetical protein JNN32_04445 [Flavobacteriales bacterium]|nr:hypothetical protein [Flavobacteriales bacterium]
MTTNTSPVNGASILTKLKEAIGWFPAFYACITIVGFIDYYTKYAPFRINIGDYLSAGELLMAFLPRAMLVIIELTMVFIFFVVIAPQLNRAIRVQVIDAEPRFTRLRRLAARRNKGANRFAKWWSRTWLGLKRGVLGIISTVFLLSVLFLIPIVATTDTRQSIPLYLLGAVMIFWLAVFIVQVAGLVRLGLLSAQGYLLILVIFTSAIYVVKIASKNRYRSDEIRAHPERQLWEVITSSDTLRSGDSLVLVGRIEAGVFLFDVTKELPILIPTSEIVRVSFAETLIDSDESVLDWLRRR